MSEKANNKTLKQILAEIDKITQTLQGDIDLEKSVTLYQTANELIKEAEKIILDAEKVIEKSKEAEKGE